MRIPKWVLGVAAGLAVLIAAVVLFGRLGSGDGAPAPEPATASAPPPIEAAASPPAEDTGSQNMAAVPPPVAAAAPPTVAANAAPPVTANAAPNSATANAARPMPSQSDADRARKEAIKSILSNARPDGMADVFGHRPDEDQGMNDAFSGIGSVEGDGLGLRNARLSALPHFPWPPPTPSEKMILPRGKMLRGLGPRPTLAGVSDRLVSALNAADYSEYSFYSAPGGFALVARLEQFELDGSPKPEGMRFLEPNAQAPFSVTSYVRHLFFAPQGFYRLILFVVTDNPVATRGPAPSALATEAWLRQGADRLPSIYRRMAFTPDHEVSVLVYEFQKRGPRNVATLVPGRLDVRSHLEKAGLYARLVRGH